MNYIFWIIKRFGRDESGAFAVIFSVMAVVLLATAGSVVDFVSIQQGRKTTQINLDATVLALQPEIYSKSQSWVTSRAEELINESLAGTGVTMSIELVDMDKDAGRLYISVNISKPTVFVKLVGINEMRATLVSESTRAKNRLEVAMVLDNSGSMRSFGRMSALKDAAELAVDILSGYESNPDKVFIGLVPFTMFVNVGAGNQNASWIDRLGRSSISWDNFDDDDNEYSGHDPSDPSDRLNRLALYASMPNTSWLGCVEARPHDSSESESDRLDVNDTVPTSADGDTLYVPLFSPDYYGSKRYSNPSYIGDYGGSCGPYTSGLSYRERQERSCKYNGQSPNPSWSSYTPNATCGDAEILPLTNNMGDVKDAIDDMVADGGTNIHQGAAWGWRVLSPTEPFDEGVAYDQGASKVMIVMTDGQNFHRSYNNINGAYHFSAYGWPYNERLGAVGWSSNQLENEMDDRTEMTCTNAKAAGIEIFTIGLSVSRNSANGQMLTACASNAGNAYFPASSSDLADTFKAIADQLSDLRLSQ